MHVTEPVRATIPVQNGARLSWDRSIDIESFLPWLHATGTKATQTMAATVMTVNVVSILLVLCLENAY